MGFRLFEVHQGIGDNDDDVSHGAFAGCRSVEADGARAAFSFDDVCFKSLAIVHVYDLDLFVLDHIGSLQKSLVNGDASHVLQVGFGNRNFMDFGFYYFDEHVCQL